MLLFTPGPTPVPENIRLSMAEPTIHHRTAEFEDIFAKTRVLLKELFNMPEVLMLASTGTGAMEASLLNLCHSKALVINAGKFGERFGKIAKAYNIPYQELIYDWDTPSTVEDVKKAISKDNSIDAIFIQICESSGGLRHPVEEISKAVKFINSDIMVVVDGITAVGVEKIDTTNIDCLISGSQKALMLPPGLSMIGLSREACEKINKFSRGYYFNLATELKKQQKNTTAYTAPTTLIIGLKAILEEIKSSGGYEKLYDETKRRSIASKVAIEAIDLKIYPKSPADAMTAVIDEKANDIRKILKEKYQVNLAGGQEHLKGKIFRINHMGLIKPYEALWVLNAIELALDELGVRKFDGTASLTFSRVYYTKELKNDL